MKSILLMSAMMIAAPAIAQTTATPAQTTPTAPASAAAPASTNAAQPATSVPAPQDTTTTTAQAAPVANPADAVATVVSTDWAKYDADKNSSLSKEEFATWMTALRDSNPAQKEQVKDVAAWTTAAFAQADADKSGSVTKPELEGFLKG